MKINLLSQELKAKRALVDAAPRLKKLITTMVIVVVVLAGSSFLINQNIDNCKKQLKQIEAGWNDTEPLLKQKEELIKRKQEVDGFYNILKDTFMRKVSWSQKLVTLPYLLPDEVWLNDVQLTVEGDKKSAKSNLTISASVGYLGKDEELLDKINSVVDNLKRDPSFFKEFNDLSLLEINKKTSPSDKNKNIMDFKIRLSLK